MNDLILNDPVIRHLLEWAERHETVRAVLLTSTRTIPGTLLDPFSDYDVILAVTDIHPFFEDRGWLGDFGPVLVVYRDPIRVEHGCERFAYITQYETDRLKIDFTVMQAGWLHHTAGSPSLPDELDVGYRVLLDKDNLTDGLQPPTYTAYIPTPPTEAAYLELIEVFFHEATYVAKNLWRDEPLPAKYSLDYVMKGKKIRQMLEWQMGIDTGWSIKTGAIGKGLKKYVQPEIWAAFEKTYVGADIKENWIALFETIELFRHVAITVGEHLGYDYPHELDRRMMVYLHEVETLAKD
jgi:aminoglycoside 6-adenylyltransferase